MAIATKTYIPRTARVIGETRETRPALPPSQGIFEGGVRAGLLAGAVMALFWGLASAAGGMGFWTPFKSVACTFLGVEGLIGGAGSVLLGLVLHFVTAAFWGVLFAGIIERDTPVPQAALSGVVYGVGVWAVMTYIGLPALDRVLDARATFAPLAWFLSHLVYGACLARTPLMRRLYSEPILVEDTQTYVEVDVPGQPVL